MIPQDTDKIITMVQDAYEVINYAPLAGQWFDPVDRRCCPMTALALCVVPEENILNIYENTEVEGIDYDYTDILNLTTKQIHEFVHIFDGNWDDYIEDTPLNNAAMELRRILIEEED